MEMYEDPQRTECCYTGSHPKQKTISGKFRLIFNHIYILKGPKMDVIAHLLKNYVLRTDLTSEWSVIKKLQKHAQR